MKLSEVLELVRLRPPELDRARRVVGRSPDLESLRAEARRRLPKAVFDYVEGGAEEEVSVAANRAAFNAYEFRPRVLVDVSKVDTSTELFGAQLSMPLGFAPTGYTRMMHPDGEMAVARVAAERRLPCGLSTVGTTTVEELSAVGHDQMWFQLYVLQRREHGFALLERAEKAGFAAVELTVDSAVPGYRIRDERNGLAFPPRLSLGTIADIGMHVGYWTDALRHPVFRFVNAPSDLTIPEITAMYDAAMTFEFLAELRARWPRTLILKGWVGAADARRAVEVGVDAIHLSNHGGRQLDRATPPLDLLSSVRAAVGPDVPLVLDSGVRSGADVALALALGADACMIGRPYIYGLAAAGQAGVEKVAQLFASGLERTMRLLGVTSIAELKALAGELVVRRGREWT